MKITEIVQTCNAYPSQWEGFIEDGRMFYARYRWGVLRVELSLEPTDDVFVAMDGQEIIHERCGDDLDGDMSTHELLSKMQEKGFITQ